MESEILVERKLVKNFFSQNRYSEGKLVVFVFLCLMLIFSILSWKNLFGLSPYLSANGQKVFQDFEVWRAFTSLFVHGDFKHLLSNTMFLCFFSYFTYSYFGFMSFPIVAIVGGFLANLITLWGMPEQIYLVGASGIVYFLGAFWLVIYVLIERHKSIRYRMLRSFGVALVLFGPGAFSPEVSYMAHFWGFVLGVIYAFILYYTQREYFFSFEEYKMDVFESHSYSPVDFQ